MISNSDLKQSAGRLVKGFKKGYIPWNKGKSITTKLTRPIHQYDSVTGDFIKTWDTVKQATIALGYPRCTIYNCLSRFTKTAHGHLWSYTKVDKIELPKRKKYKHKKGIAAMNINELKLMITDCRKKGSNITLIKHIRDYSNTACSIIRPLGIKETKEFIDTYLKTTSTTKFVSKLRETFKKEDI